MDILGGKTAVVTGAASGLGLAFAKRFAAAGMHVVLSDIEAPALDQAMGEVEAALTPGRRARAVVTDVADEDAVAELAATSIGEFGRVNVVCNNAGVAETDLMAGLETMQIAQWRWVLDVNLFGVIHGHAHFLPHLLEHGDGHIVNTASMAGHLPSHSAYAASKWAVVGITEGLYHQLGASGSTVGVSCLCPGWVKTRIADSARNRPEYAAPTALVEPSEQVSAGEAYIRDQLASGLDPAVVADMVHDAIVERRFWIFTDPRMVEQLRGRFDAVLEQRNPDVPPRAFTASAD